MHQLNPGAQHRTRALAVGRARVACLRHGLRNCAEALPEEPCFCGPDPANVAEDSNKGREPPPRAEIVVSGSAPGQLVGEPGCTPHREARTHFKTKGVAMAVGGMRRLLALVTAAATVAALGAGCSGSSDDSSSGGKVTLEFAQWWGAELP